MNARTALAAIALLAATGCSLPTADTTQKPTPAPTPTAAAATEPLPADCRAWIEDELLDASETIDAGPGSEACGHLSETELDEAIDTVTDDLIEQGATPAP
ncbi:hypothetical protein ACIRLA_33760 [Streptomyces sp. NPDC102364]|uniref:hypothetical protein n=1 Tax=Streptomyces sp. NPDC102364 TaxID=3366161 RepID=UPI00381EC38D